MTAGGSTEAIGGRVGSDRIHQLAWSHLLDEVTIPSVVTMTPDARGETAVAAGSGPRPLPARGVDDFEGHAVQRWAESGAAYLTGRAGGPPLGPPSRLVAGLDALAETLPGLDPLGRLVERAAIAGLARSGRASCGGNCHLLETDDGWLAVSLLRPEDVALLPAWLGLDPAAVADNRPPWAALAGAVRRQSGSALEERAALLGLATGRLGTTTRPAVLRTALGPAEPTPRLDGLLVVDLTSLWAGPLCGALLASLGATVIKVESKHRPDGARAGPPAFFDCLNAAKRSVVLDFKDQAGLGALRALINGADVVLEASRPRALQQLGFDAAALVAAGGPRVWISITAHGRSDVPECIGFGDDAAVAGGLVAHDDSGPVFCADAVADPCAGMAAAAAGIDALAGGDRWLLDVSLAAVAANLAGPTLALPSGLPAPPPHAPPPGPAAPAAGADTAAVLNQLGARG